MTVISEKELWTKKPFKKKIKDDIDKTHWAKIKVDRDKKTNKDFFHVWVGQRFKGEKREKRLHYGINLNQTLLFACPRQVGIALKREVTSKLKGFLASDEIKFNNKIKGMLKNLSLSFKIEGSTGEVWVNKFEFK